MSKTDPSRIPHGLDLTIDFVNTLDVEAASDALDTPAHMRDWLAQRGLLDKRAPAASERERVEAIELREALRELMYANNDGRDAAGAWAALDRAARAGDLAVRFEQGAGVALAAAPDGVPAALARVLIPVADAIPDGSWRRAKACPGDECGWAFYDRSRNRSAVWCEMAVCGNRTKVRAYRDRGAR